MGNKLGTYMGMGDLPLQIEHVSLASTRVMLTNDQQGKLLVLDDSTGSTVEIHLPAPEAGMRYTLYFSTGSVTAVTKVLSTAYDIRYDVTTTPGVALASTDEDGQIMEFVGKNDYLWLCFAGSRYTTLATAAS